MADLNQVSLIGRLTRDPVLKMTSGGMAIATFGLATSHKYKDQTGALREESTFVDITCWGKLADTVAKYLKKGRQVFIGGRLKFESWEDKQTGQKRSKLSVTASDAQFLDSKKEENGEQAQPQSQTPPQAFPEPEPPGPPGDPASWGEPSADQPPF